MTKLIVFDNVSLKTALLARQILDMNSGIWIFMVGNVPQNNQPVMFADDDNISWLLNFCDLTAADLYENANRPVTVHIPDVTQETLIDRLLNKPNLSLTSDTPCTINFETRQVKLDDSAGYSYVPFGNINSIFVAKPIDQFYGYKFGHLMYRKMPHIDATKFDYLHGDDVIYESDINGGIFSRRLVWNTDSNVMHSNVKFELTQDSADVYAVDVAPESEVLFNRYLAHNKVNKQIKYIGPRRISWPSNPFLVDMTSLFDNIRKI